MGGHVREPGHEELAALRGLADLLLLLFLQLLLGRLDEAQLLLPLGPDDVGQILGALGVVAEADVRLVDAFVDLADVGLQLAGRQRREAVRVVRARLAVVRSLDLAGVRVLPDLEDLEVIQFVQDLGERLRLDFKTLVHQAAASPPPSVARAFFSCAALIMSSVRPEDNRIVHEVFWPVSTSAAVTFTMPLVSISNVTSMRTSPR